MKTTSGPLPKIDVLKNSEGLSINRDRFPYLFLFLFRDNFYSVACKRCLDRRSINLVLGACSAAATKRSIDSVRYQDYSEIFYSEFVRRRSSRLSIDLYLHVLLQTVCLILGVPLLCRLAAETNNNSKISQSIHSIFLFLEDRLPKSSHVLELEMSQNLHLETLVRLLRRQIRDVPFLHLLRIVFHTYKTLCGEFTQLRSWKQEGRRSIDMLLQNFYTYEIDSIPLASWTRMHKSNPIYFVSTDQNNMTRKKIRVSEYSSQSDAMNIDHCLTRILCIHFARFRNKSIIASHGTQYFAKKWSYYISIFYRSHFHYPIDFTQIRINLLSASCVLFLGYISVIQPVSKNVWVETAVDPCNSNSISGGKEIHPRVPILLLVKLLEKEKFCDGAGHPVSKLAWTVLTDDEILNRFSIIWNTFSSYHSASTNRDGLRRLRYILRLSRDSTSAGRHRSTTRLLRRRFDRELPEMVSTSSKLNSFETSQRFWHLSLVKSVSLKFVALKKQV
uniref:Maturase K n=1 Tax=Woodwardia japonica TaxID=120728 RepID=A0A7D7KMN5_9MONI|nr:maturase K [Woodwardia japonica]QMS48595.1 maturase K [Woodwardia japonica]